MVLTSFYADPDPARCAELVGCLERNAAADAVDEVHVLVEDGVRPDVDDDKVRLVDFGRRATFADLFDYANENLAGRRVVIANADIYFDDGLARVGAVDLTDTILCLSRWDVDDGGRAQLFVHGESQDAWIFDAPIRAFSSDFPLGIPGCDNRLAYEAAAAGLTVENPAGSLRAYHLHVSGVRRYTWDRRIVGDVLSVPAGYLGPPRTQRIASARFSEPMGYVVRTLSPGVSSHVNEERPFTVVPDALRGLRFTQVVAHHNAPVELELTKPGKLYVLAGDDWYGFEDARAWLAEHGFDERLPRLRTATGAGFEAWSLVGDTGDRYVVPMQVMLAGRRLVR